MKNLKSFRVDFCKGLQPHGPVFLQALSMSAPNVRFLNLSGLDFAESVLSIYLNFSKAVQHFNYTHNFELKKFSIFPSFTVQHLRLSQCPELGLISIEGSNSNLRVIDISNSGLTDEKVLYNLLDHTPCLQELVVTSTGISEETIAVLNAAFPSVLITNIPAKRHFLHEIDFDGIQV
jgi:hypothetical protein